MSGNFAEVCRRLSAMSDAPTNWHLLSLTFDVEHDTPEVLRDHARRYDYDPNRWSFATGALIDIDALTEQFGLMFPRQGQGILFDHNLRTVVVDAGGRVRRIFIGNDWTADELAAEIIEAAKAR